MADVSLKTFKTSTDDPLFITTQTETKGRKTRSKRRKLRSSAKRRGLRADVTFRNNTEKLWENYEHIGDIIFQKFL